AAEADGGLVEEQDLRLGHEGARHLDEALLAEAELGAHAVGEALHADEGEGAARRAGAAAPASSARAAGRSRAADSTPARRWRCRPVMTFSSTVMPRKSWVV